MISKKEFLKLAQKQYKISKSGLQSQYDHIKECRAFYAGDYMNYRDKVAFGTGALQSIREVEFNKVKPYVNAIVGFMIGQRRQPDYQAKLTSKPEQQMYSDYLNSLSDYIRRNTYANQMETRQDMDMVIGGIGVTDTCLTLNGGEATRDPNGEILVERVDPLQAGYDPSASMPNLLDSRWVYRAKDFDLEEAESLFDAEDGDFESIQQDDDIGFTFNPIGGIQDKIGFEYSDANREMVRVYFHQFFQVEKFYRIDNPLLVQDNPALAQALGSAFAAVENDEEGFSFDPAAQVLIITQDVKKQVVDIFKAFEVPFKPIEEKRKVFYTGIYSGSKVFRLFKSPSQQGFSIKFKTGDRDEVNKIWTGIVASMRDPSRYYNKSLTEMMLIIASNSRGGVMYEEDAVDNVQEFEKNYAKTNGAVKVNRGALSGNKIQPKAVPALPTGYENILQISDASMGQVTGINESFFGVSASGNETAMLQRQRMAQSTTILAPYFDSIELYGIEQARMMLSFIRLLVAAGDGKLFKAMGDDGQVIFEKMSLEFLVDEYEIEIGELPETPLLNEYKTQQIATVATGMMQVGDQRYREMYAAAVDYMPFTTREKVNIKRILLGEAPIDPQLVQQLKTQIEQLQSKQAASALAWEQAQTLKTQVSAAETAAKTENIKAGTRKLNEEIEGKAIENDLMQFKLPSEVNVTI
jgi:hypothetical protein